MASLSLVETAISDGIWHGILSSAEALPKAPQLTLSLDGAEVGQAELTGRPGAPGSWDVRFEIPRAAIRDGLATILVSLAGEATPLIRVPIEAGKALDEDLRYEIAALRAELDLLASAFRRHVRGTEPR